jgi:hypothetical protein
MAMSFRFLISLTDSIGAALEFSDSSMFEVSRAERSSGSRNGNW